MKAVMIIYNLALTEKVEYALEYLGVRGFTRWNNVDGTGTSTGEPRLGTHTWPEINGATLTLVEEEKVPQLLEAVKRIDAINTEVGIRAFVWSVEETV